MCASETANLPASLAEALSMAVCAIAAAFLHTTYKPCARNMFALSCPPTAMRRRFVQLFSEWHGDILRPQPVQWDRQSAVGRLLLRPGCWLPTGCLYLWT